MVLVVDVMGEVFQIGVFLIGCWIDVVGVFECIVVEIVLQEQVVGGVLFVIEVVFDGVVVGIVGFGLGGIQCFYVKYVGLI